MSHSRGFIRNLRKICLILLLALTVIMLFHILITLFLYTYVSPWNLKSSPTHAAISVLLYYVIPLIIFLFFYLIFNEFNTLESARTAKKQDKKQVKKANKVAKAKKKDTQKHKKKQPLQYGCYTPRDKVTKKSED